jgi:HSP20 family protein
MFGDVVNGVFDGFGSRALSPFFGSWSGATPTMDVEETERGIVISAELPGLGHKDFEVTVSGDVLTLKERCPE